MEDKVPDIITQIIEEDEVLAAREKELLKEAYDALEEGGSFNIKKAQEIFENLPSSKIARVLAQILYKEQPRESLKEMLKNELEISEQKAAEMEEKINESILKLLGNFSQRKEPPLTNQQQKRKEGRSYDPYREPFEEIDERERTTFSEATFSEELAERGSEREDKISLEEKIRKIIRSELREELEEELPSSASEIGKKSGFSEIKIEKREKKPQKTDERKESFFKPRKIDPYRESCE